MKEIDFVIIWVDGSDPTWIKEKAKFSGKELSSSAIDSAAHRFRDWENLKYLFRGIEKFAPWVRKVHFVTCGHIPEWLDLNNEKLNFVKHEDYIPREYLPVFSANPIELNLHHIEDLSEHFVFFNDDMFILRSLKQSQFFTNNLPNDTAALSAVTSSNPSDIFSHMMLNVAATLNKNFDKNSVVRANPTNWFSLNYNPRTLLQNLYFMPGSTFSGFAWSHLPSAFLKSSFKEVWSSEQRLLENTSSHKFRHIEDVNQYLVRGWQIATNKFHPYDIEKNNKAFFDLSNQLGEISDAIKEQRYSMVCLNDSDNIEDFENTKKKILQSFDAILPDKSSFEL